MKLKLQRKQHLPKTKLNNKQLYRQFFSLFLCALLLPCIIVGCGSHKLSEMSPSANTTECDTDNTGMGRYTETIMDLPSDLSGSVTRLFKMADDRLVLTDTTTSFLISKDNGNTWFSDEPVWHTRLLNDENYIMDMALGPDNTAAIIYEPNIDTADSDHLLPQLLLINPDGTQIPVSVGSTNDEPYLNKVFIMGGGRIFVTAFIEDHFNIYEIMKDGSNRLFLAMDEKAPEQLLLSDHLMIIYGSEYEYPLIYDVTSEAYLKDHVLSDFVSTHHAEVTLSAASKNPFYTADWYLFSEGDKSIYLAGQDGLYRHTIGGAAMEQIIDGNLSVLSDPSYNITGITLLDNHEFFAAFGNHKLVRFTYDSNIPVKPSEILKIYSLENNDTIRQAITLYRIDHPDVYIEYDVGMSDDGVVTEQNDIGVSDADAITREDAIKKLNTEIIAGNGPDVIVMDDLPFSSYIEKGLLKDLVPTLNELNDKEPLFANIMDAMKSGDGEVYALPSEIQLPILFGDQSVISQMNDLESIADTAESMKQKYPGQDLIGTYTAEDILRLLTVASAPSWTTEKDAVNTQSISAFLEQAKRLYDVQTENFNEESPEIYVVGAQRNKSDTLINLKVIEYVGGYLPSFTCGVLYSPHTYAELSSINRISGFESCDWRAMNGQNDHIFIAKTIIGISQTAHNAECAEDFLQVCMSAPNQSNLYNGLPVNKTALNDVFSSDKAPSASSDPALDDQPYDSEFLADSDGNLISIDIYHPNEESIAALCTCIEDADTPYITDQVLEAAIYEHGAAYLQGNISLEEALDAIEKKLTIYMTE